ncbi:MAG: hypothetical protein GW778_03515 [Alphaproteobacteria bacterium]|nr:hypothetical protein [Alphaproteobacteria bacterium]
MPYLIILSAIIIFIPLSASAQQQKATGCASHKNFRSQILFDIQIAPTIYNHRMNRKSLTIEGRQRIKNWRKQHENNAWVSGTDDSNWHTQGVTRGGVSMTTNTDLIAKPYDKYGIYYCPYVKKILVTIKYGSEIFIAKDHKKGTCEYNEILAHEERHHETNVTVVETLAMRMEADMPRLIAMMENRYVQKGSVQDEFEKLKQSMSDALDIYLEEITIRKKEFNALVDTPQE